MLAGYLSRREDGADQIRLVVARANLASALRLAKKNIPYAIRLRGGRELRHTDANILILN